MSKKASRCWWKVNIRVKVGASSTTNDLFVSMVKREALASANSCSGAPALGSWVKHCGARN